MKRNWVDNFAGIIMGATMIGFVSLLLLKVYEEWLLIQIILAR